MVDERSEKNKTSERIEKNKTSERSILFVCTGNVFRSLSAEQLLKKYILDNNLGNWKVSSAGITAKPQDIDKKVLEVLHNLGVEKFNHKQKKLTREMLNEYDIIITMAENHYRFVKDELHYKNVLMFNELVVGKNTSIWDVEDDVKDYATNRPAVEEKIEKTIKYISASIPNLFKQIRERFYLFSDFVNGTNTHNNGYPFIKLYETKNTVTFMSNNIPQKMDSHVLVVPKKRYVDVSEIPDEILSELISVVKKIGSVISKNCGGYNILLNNGYDAGQYIFHTHFHLIPRMENDDITMNMWKRKNISEKEFIELNRKLQNEIDKS